MKRYFWDIEVSAGDKRTVVSIPIYTDLGEEKAEELGRQYGPGKIRTVGDHTSHVAAGHPEVEKEGK